MFAHLTGNGKSCSEGGRSVANSHRLAALIEPEDVVSAVRIGCGKMPAIGGKYEIRTIQRGTFLLRLEAYMR